MLPASMFAATCSSENVTFSTISQTPNAVRAPASTQSMGRTPRKMLPKPSLMARTPSGVDVLDAHRRLPGGLRCARLDEQASAVEGGGERHGEAQRAESSGRGVLHERDDLEREDPDQ